MKSRRIPAWLAGAGLVVLILITYRPVFSNGWIWDDDHYVSQNTTLRTVDGLKRIWIAPTATPQYYPLTFTSFWVEEHIFGLAPTAFHRDNVLLHAANALLLWLILRRLGVPASWFIAALWAVHPVNVESVAWASERKNVLSGFFYLLAALAYWPFIEDEKARGWGRYLLAIFLFLLSLLSKTVSATFPGAMLLLIWWGRGGIGCTTASKLAGYTGERKIGKRDLLRMVPFVAVALPLCWLTSHIERTFVGARGAEFAFSLWQRFGIAAHAAWFYAGKDIWPVDLSFIYPRWRLDQFQIVYLLALLGALAGLILLARRWGRGVMVGPLFFLGTLLPALGFVNVYPMRFSFVADHFQYLASVGLIAFIVSAIRRTGTWVRTPMARIGADAILATLALLAYHRAGIFSDSVTLWSDALAKNPASWMVRTNLGAALLDRGEDEVDHHQTFAAARDFSGAELQFQKAHAIRGDLTEPLTNLARIEELQGHFGAAERWLRQALAINPNAADVHFHLGAVLVKDGQIDAGIAEYSQALLIDQKHVPAWVNLGVALDTEGKTQTAIDAYTHALTIDPDSVLALTDLGNAYLKLHRPAKAAEAFRRALAIERGFQPAEEGLRAAVHR